MEAWGAYAAAPRAGDGAAARSPGEQQQHEEQPIEVASERVLRVVAARGPRAWRDLRWPRQAT